MKKAATLIFINIVLGLFQTAFFPELFGKQSYINWVFVFGLAWLLVDAPITALKSVFIGGLILDILSSSRLGLSPLLLTIFIYLLVLTRKYLFKGLTSHILIATILCYLYSLVIFKTGAAVNFKLLVFAAVSSLLSVFVSLLLRQVLLSRK